MANANAVNIKALTIIHKALLSKIEYDLTSEEGPWRDVEYVRPTMIGWAKGQGE